MKNEKKKHKINTIWSRVLYTNAPKSKTNKMKNQKKNKKNTTKSKRNIIQIIYKNTKKKNEVRNKNILIKK